MKSSSKSQQRAPIQNLLSTQQANEPAEQKKVVSEIVQINILREQMLNDALGFTQELNDLQSQLAKKSRELDILTSKQMNEISEKNISLVEEFIKYQNQMIEKLEVKNSNWDRYDHELNNLSAQFARMENDEELVPKLAKIQVMENEIQQLIEQVEELKAQKEKRRR